MTRTGEETPELSLRLQAALLALGRLSSGCQAFLDVLDGDALVRLGLADLYGKGQFVLTVKGEEMLDRLRRQPRQEP